MRRHFAMFGMIFALFVLSLSTSGSMAAESGSRPSLLGKWASDKFMFNGESISISFLFKDDGALVVESRADDMDAVENLHYEIKDNTLILNPVDADPDDDPFVVPFRFEGKTLYLTVDGVENALNPVEEPVPTSK